MSPGRTEEVAALQELIDETRRFFHQLRVAAQQVHGGSTMTAGLRGVLLDLFKNGDQTVPAMARARPVSRQHIQTLVDQLHRGGLLRLKNNPAHRRSKLISLTRAGHAAAEGMLKREAEVLGALDLPVSEDSIRSAAHVLRSARELLRGSAWERAIGDAGLG